MEHGNANVEVFPHITFSDYVNVKPFPLKSFHLHDIQMCIIKQRVNGVLVDAVKIALATCFLLLQTMYIRKLTNGKYGTLKACK